MYEDRKARKVEGKYGVREFLWHVNTAACEMISLLNLRKADYMLCFEPWLCEEFGMPGKVARGTPGTVARGGV